MSKKKSRIKKALLAGAALYAGSKLMGAKRVAQAKNMPVSMGGGKDMAKVSTKKFLPSRIGKETAGITKVPESSLKKYSLKKDGSNPTRNMKSIFVQDDGSIIKGTTKFKNKKVYSDAMKKKRGESGNTKSFLNKFILGKKTQLNKGSMVKARGGGMARMKPTRLY